MLATFNEILFKMPSADSVKFHVEIQLEERFEKVCSLPSYFCNVWNPPQSQKKFLISLRWSADIKKYFRFDHESIFQFEFTKTVMFTFVFTVGTQNSCICTH